MGNSPPTVLKGEFMLMLLGLMSSFFAAGFVFDASSESDSEEPEQDLDVEPIDPVLGTSEADTLVGSDENDVIAGGAGDDILSGELGNDTIFGNDGNDILMGNDGDDWLDGGNGVNSVTGGNGADTFALSTTGTQGTINNITDFNPSEDRLVIGLDTPPSGVLTVEDWDDGTGADIVYMGNIIASVAGAQGLDPTLITREHYFPDPAPDTAPEPAPDTSPDTALSTEQPDDIDLGTGEDSLARYLDEHAETLFGTSGNDQVTIVDESGEGRDASYVLGDGDDTIVGTAGSEFFAGMDGDDTIYSGEGQDRIFGGAGDDYIVNESGLGLIVGHDGNDVIFGGSDKDIIGGGDGDDTIYGGAGDDYLTGGGGADYISGGDGNDYLSGTTGNNPDQTDMGTGIDILDGGAGDDTLIMTRGEVGIGGTGSDVFSIASTGSLDTAVGHVADFEPDVDSLALFYRNDDGIPSVDVSYDADSDITNVYMNGELACTLAGDAGLTPDAIDLHEQYY